MITIIVYSSKSGNTKKLAEAMASQLGSDSVRITSETASSTVNLEGYDLVLVGTGLYAGTPNEDLVKYLKSINLNSTRLFALFITWGGAPRSDKIALAKLRALLESKGQKILTDHFAAYGGWRGILMKRDHPKPEEIVAGAQWAVKVVENYEKID